jgi:hypothetical protein
LVPLRWEPKRGAQKGVPHAPPQKDADCACENQSLFSSQYIKKSPIRDM